MQPRSGVTTIINATLRPPKIETGSSAVSSTLGCPGGTVIGCRGQHSRSCLSGVPMVCRGHKSLKLPIKTPSRFYQGSRWAKEPKGFLMGLRFAVMLNMAANLPRLFQPTITNLLLSNHPKEDRSYETGLLWRAFTRRHSTNPFLRRQARPLLHRHQILDG
jgi:hypothetical protein